MESDLQKSDTLWTDPEISSLVRIGTFRVTQEVTVQRMEYLTEFASMYPIPEIPTAIAQNEKFNFTDKQAACAASTRSSKIKYVFSSSFGVHFSVMLCTG